MPDPFHPDDLPSNPAADAFFAGALDRIRRFMLVIAAVATCISFFVYDWKVAVGVLLGCMVAWASFVWLKQAVSALAEKVSQSGEPKSSAGTVAKFLLRYVLVGLGAYAIFLSSHRSLYGFLGGLFLAVAAILCEAAYEAVVSLRRGY